ncbi:16S rRNA (adenine(1518)-N(6)/adenine(1519)-N(6)) -dimethyltransferase RsmA [Lentibacillus halophilus]|uniref:Ribosomal RNA small subunit methyltransferase A n=1 Tax=Lentibacillus halophilus TaxID=295065 RepID=A0ABP3J5X5_9BACI
MNEKPIATPKRTADILQKHGFSVKKSLGQNFIVDVTILQHIIQKADIHQLSGVIEVGPGIGALTEQLAKVAKTVVAYEIDNRLFPILNDTLRDYNHIKVIHQDILEADVSAMMETYFDENQPVHVVANLPYYITTPILIKLLREDLPVSSFTVMIQKEVAQRMAAGPNSKAYGSLTIAIQYYTDAKVVMNVPKGVFMPSPNVDSSVLKLTKKTEPPVKVDDEDYFFSVVQACFAQRRKTLRNNLRHYFGTSVNKEMISDVLLDTGIDPQRRGESLAMEEFAALANVLYRTF